jgi:hypothetical protein
MTVTFFDEPHEPIFTEARKSRLYSVGSKVLFVKQQIEDIQRVVVTIA